MVAKGHALHLWLRLLESWQQQDNRKLSAEAIAAPIAAAAVTVKMDRLQDTSYGPGVLQAFLPDPFLDPLLRTALASWGYSLATR